MTQLKMYFIVLGALCAPSTIFCQKDNRISIQRGVFHSFFDESAIINKNLNSAKRKPNNLFRGALNDSKGVQFQRSINAKSSISLEYLGLDAGYDYDEVFNYASATPVVYSRNLKYTNITYSRNIELTEKFKFVFGGGINYLWGLERIYHYTYFNGFGEPRFYNYYRNDFGINARTGIEYSPLPWLTINTNFDFIGILYSDAKDLDGNNAEKWYEEKFDLSNKPSRYDLSWRFGIGFNF